jgi:hypothetical protein
VRPDPAPAPEGGCLCKSIRYRISATPLAQSRCHCRSCRLASGAPSVAWIVLNCSDFTFVTGDPVRYRSSPPVVRSFCGKCGTPLTYQHDDSPDTVDVTTATLDLPDAFPPTREIWIEHKLAWEVLDEDLRHYRRGSSESSGDAP